jgi:hypothetical protein
MTGTVLTGGTLAAGLQPLVGATVILWSTGATAAPLTGATATTGATGAFSLTYTCPSPNTLIYATASGGHVGAAAPSARVQLVSVLGTCGVLSPSIVINDLTTVAAAWALSGFAAPATGSAATWVFQGKSPGINQAFNTLSNLDNTGTGLFDPTGPETNQSLVQKKLDTLANAVNACNGAAGAACAELFSCASVNATYVASGQPCTGGTSTPATDTLGAALLVTQNQGTISLQGVWDTGTATTAPYAPVLALPPNDWALFLIISPLNAGGNPVRNDGPIAIDANGHAWLLAQDPNPPPLTTSPALAVLELDANLNLLTPTTHATDHGFTGGGVSGYNTTDTTNLAIDTAGNVWVGGSENFVAELNSQGAGVAPPTGWPSGGPNGPDGTAGVAIDTSGNAWFASGFTNSTVFEFSSAGANLSGVGGYAATNCPCNGIAADPSGNVWTVGNTGGPGSQFLASITGGNQGAILHPPGYATASFDSVAADAAGNLWIADQHNHGVWEFTPAVANTSAGTFLPASGGPFVNTAAPGTTPKAVAIDGAGHKWVANQTTTTGVSSVTELSADGMTNLSPPDGFGSGFINGAYAVAIDESGNVWVTDGGTTIAQFIGAAAPTRNPIASAVKNGFAP